MSHNFLAVKKLFLILFFVTVSPFLASCEMTQNYLKHDRENNMEPQDYRDALAPRPLDIRDKSAGRLSGNIPPLKPYVAAPDTNYKPMPLVTISVNQTVPIRDVIYEIAEQAEYDVELDPRIRGSIIFSARNRPLDMVIERIAEIAGLRYSFEENMLRVQMDTPYHEIYKINYLALTRTNASSISNNVSVVSGEGSDTGSSFSASNESVIDFWQELETNLTQIVESNRDSARLATERDPTVTVAQGAPAPVDPLVMDDNGNLAQEGPNVQVAVPAAVLNVNALEGDDDGGDEGEDPFESRFSLNRQAGLVSVFAPERLQKKIDTYLKTLKKSVTAQVLIEAKVLEVSLKDEFSAGIDWSVLFDSGASGGLGFGSQATDGLVRGILATDGSLASNSSVSYISDNFNAAIDALSRFGTVQGLASPRLTVLNNQSAALSVAENVVYFSIDVETTVGDTGPPVTSFETEAQTVPEGVLINVQPAIDTDLGIISMAIRPTITSIVGFTNDPNPALAAAGVISPVPNVNVQEFDSILQMNSGQAVVLGGLIQDRVVSTRNGVPVLGETPLLGGLFRNQQDQVEKTELVVFLKATIVEGGNTIHATDKDLYRTFSSDRRPFDL
jgi:general secretion pathway protein D